MGRGFCLTTLKFHMLDVPKHALDDAREALQPQLMEETALIDGMTLAILRCEPKVDRRDGLRRTIEYFHEQLG